MYKRGEKYIKVINHLSQLIMYDSLPYAGINQFKFGGLATAISAIYLAPREIDFNLYMKKYIIILKYDYYGKGNYLIVVLVPPLPRWHA